MSSSPQPVLINSSQPADSHKDKKGMLWAVLTSFFLMWVFFYVCFQVFAPTSVQQGDAYATPGTCERRPADPAKCFVASLVVTIIVMLLLWLVVASMK